MDRPILETVRWYLAGKIGGGETWRNGLVRDFAWVSDEWWSKVEHSGETPWPELEGAVWRCAHWNYVGPFCARGMTGQEWNEETCGHGGTTGQHFARQEVRLGGNGPGDRHRRSVIHGLCLDAIRRCDVLFAWITGPDCYGTLLEVGYAAALGKKILIATSDVEKQWSDELWFALECQNFGNLIPPVHTAREAFIYFEQWAWNSRIQASLSDQVKNLRRELQESRQPSLPPAIEVRLDPQRTFSKLQRDEILRRSNGHCVGCGTPLGADWHADHIVPHARGGRTEVINGQALCRPCNSRKSAKVLTVDE